MNENERDGKKGKVGQKKNELEMEYVQRRQHEDRIVW